MFKMKGKASLQELEIEFNKKQFLLGSLLFQREALQKEINKTLQEMDNLTKQGITMKKKLITEEVHEKVTENKNTGNPSENN